MAGKIKRNKTKKSSSQNASPQFVVMNPDDNRNDDQELMNDLMLQLDSRDQNVQKESATVLSQMNLNKQPDQTEPHQKQSAKGRFQARQARKAAALAQIQPPSNAEKEARLKREAEEEEHTIKRICDELELRIHEISADGHCLYSAVADQLALLSILPPEQATFVTARLAASTYIWKHPHDFLPFLPEESPGVAVGPMSPQSFEQYCARIRDTSVWGGEPEILALSRAFDVPIHVVQWGSPSVVVHNPTRAPAEGDVMDKSQKVVRISYHRRMYGLGEHYNSLRPSPKGKLIKNPLLKISR